MPAATCPRTKMLDRVEKGARARALFLSGYSCSQSVLIAFSPETGVDEKTSARLASGLGGGLGGLRMMCGAFTAACVVLGKVLGFDDPADFDQKKYLYALEQNLASRFTQQYETLNCRALMEKAGVLVSSSPSPRTAEYYQKRPCGLYVEEIAMLLCDVLNEEAQ